MRRYLVVANRTLGAPELIQAIRHRHAAGPCEFYLLAPATAPGNPADWYGALTAGVPPAAPPSSATHQESVEHPRMRLETELARLREEGMTVAGQVGGSDPFRAVSELLSRRQFDEVIVSTRSPGLSRWLHLDLPSRIERKLHVPVTHVVVGETSRAHSP
jgi:hypothetical protein